MRIKGSVKGDSLVIRFGEPGKKKSRRSFYLDKKVFLPAQISAILSLGGEPPGKFYVLDPSTLTLEPATIKNRGEEAVKIHGKEKRATLYEMEYLGTITKTWVKDGVILKEESPMNLVAIYETEDQATRTPGERVDLLYLFAVKPEGLNVDPTTKSFVKLKLSGLKTENLDLDFGNQKVLKKGKDWAIVEYKVEAPKRQLKDTLIFLQPTPFMQVDDPEIKSKENQDDTI